MEALETKNAKLLLDYERVEGEYQALKLKTDAASKAQPKKATPVTVELAKLRFKHTTLTTAHATLQERFEELSAQAGGSSSEGGGPTDGGGARRTAPPRDGGQGRRRRRMGRRRRARRGRGRRDHDRRGHRR